MAGRGDVIEEAAVALDRIGEGRDAKSVLFVGLRGVGKTVLLNRVAEDAEARGMVCVRAEAPEGRSLPAALAPPLRRALIELDRFEAAKARIRRGRRVLASFVSKMRLVYRDVEIRIDAEPETGLAVQAISKAISPTCCASSARRHRIRRPRSLSLSTSCNMFRKIIWRRSSARFACAGSADSP